ncbi:MAG TPA: T9SS type A sorting domain-containing protein, partial [Chitinophagaceae bacterium]|nr:T9SS type A sorting domain-containing protein [Chitinophagaceae bacterium]
QNSDISYSEAKTLVFEKVLSVVVVNNPVKGQLLLAIDAPEANVLAYSIHDVSARIVLQGRFRLLKGRNDVRIGVTSLPKGVYLFSFMENDLKLTKKFIVA